MLNGQSDRSLAFVEVAPAHLVIQESGIPSSLISHFDASRLVYNSYASLRLGRDDSFARDPNASHPVASVLSPKPFARDLIQLEDKEHACAAETPERRFGDPKEAVKTCSNGPDGFEGSSPGFNLVGFVCQSSKIQTQDSHIHFVETGHGRHRIGLHF